MWNKFSFMSSIDIWSTQSINKYGVDVFPYKTLTTMSKKSVSSSFLILVTISLGRPYASSIRSIFPLSMESNALEKFTNKCVIPKYFFLYSFCEIVERFFRFSFFWEFSRYRLGYDWKVTYHKPLHLLKI